VRCSRTETATGRKRERKLTSRVQRGPEAEPFISKRRGSGIGSGSGLVVMVGSEKRISRLSLNKREQEIMRRAVFKGVNGWLTAKLVKADRAIGEKPLRMPRR